MSHGALELEFSPRLILAASVYGQCWEEVSMHSDSIATTLITLVFPFVAPKRMLTEAETSIGRYSGC